MKFHPGALKMSHSQECDGWIWPCGFHGRLSGGKVALLYGTEAEGALFLPFK